ncbi:MAG: beta-galactosidase [Fidelibacterota bacterium]|nr:MAG: beta-galactosidase [Candidatus Neomarinimicrobiota bacterium]
MGSVIFHTGIKSVFVGLPFIVIIALVACTTKETRTDWRPVEGRIMSRWAQEVSPDNALPEYPRPQLVRKEWLNLNGLWEYAIQPEDAPQPETFQGHILVPFPIESALSGVGKAVGPDNRLWYQRTFKVPPNWADRRILLHFGAVDWETTVWVNGREVGTHRGGYDPFTFDISEALRDDGPQVISLSVWDPTDAGTQPRGKQVSEPEGIWYTAVTGIWQTVWLEPVPPVSIDGLTIVPDIDRGEVSVTVTGRNTGSGHQVSAVVRDGSKTVSRAEGAVGETLSLPIENAKLWSPDSPFLYDLEVTLQQGGETADVVDSYFGMRKISLGQAEGLTRLFLNNRPLFQYGLLDQGWWPDGLYTAPTDEALRYDLEVTKELGFNMLRKHVKVERQRFYYWCDKLGLLVWQDMPNGDRHVERDQPDIQRSPESAQQYELELKRMIEAHRNHPCIVIWVPFNEGWGQFDTPRIVDLIKDHDPTRLVINASGWADRGVGDIHDVHRYPGPAAPPNEQNRAAVLGEFGGLGLPLKGHTWQDEENWGYRSYQTAEELTAAYLDLLQKLRPMIDQGLSAAVYTQTTDVEIEVNGQLTYDRAVIKMDVEKVAAANKGLYQH